MLPSALDTTLDTKPVAHQALAPVLPHDQSFTLTPSQQRFEAAVTVASGIDA